MDKSGAAHREYRSIAWGGSDYEKTKRARNTRVFIARLQVWVADSNFGKKEGVQAILFRDEDPAELNSPLPSH